jgi:hypothetical protein
MKKLFLLALSFMFAMLIVSCGDEPNDDPKTDVDNVEVDVVKDDGPLPVDDAVDPVDDGEVADEDVVEVVCTLEDTFLDVMEGVDTYFSFRAVGVINDGASTAQPTAAFQFKMFPVMPGQPNFKLTQPLAFYQAETQNGTELIDFLALGDPVGTHYTSIVFVALQKEWLVANRDAIIVTPEIPEAPTVQILVLSTPDATTLKQCVVAANAIDDAGLAIGKMKICTTPTQEFIIDENMKMAVNAKLTEDPTTLVALFGYTDESELCSCFEATSPYANKDCPGTEIPDDDVILTD